MGSGSNQMSEQTGVYDTVRGGTEAETTGKVPPQSNGTTGASLVRAEVLARLALGHTKRQIARDLHIGRHRIDAILVQHQRAPLGTTRIARILPLAYDAVEKT